jgi:hypothetical protein
MTAPPLSGQFKSEVSRPTIKPKLTSKQFLPKVLRRCHVGATLRPDNAAKVAFEMLTEKLQRAPQTHF